MQTGTEQLKTFSQCFTDQMHRYEKNCQKNLWRRWIDTTGNIIFQHTMMKWSGNIQDAALPDRTVSVEDMKEYGYTSDGMLPLGTEAAFFYYNENLPVMLLYPDGTEAYPENADDMTRHAEYSGMFGMEKDVWERELNKAGAEKYKNPVDCTDIVHNEDKFSATYHDEMER